MIPSKNKGRFHERMLSIAAEIAILSEVPRYQFGALLVANKTIISSGSNSTKTHPTQLRVNQYREIGKRERSFAHAEVSCLAKVRRPVIDGTIYVARVDANGETKMARPCAGCMDKIISHGIKTIVYTTDTGYAVERILGVRNG